MLYIHFTRRPNEVLDIKVALGDLLGDEGAVGGNQEGIGGEFGADGDGWGYEVPVYDLEAVDGWADRLAAELPTLLREMGESELPWLEVMVVSQDDSKLVLRRIDLG